MSIFPLVMNRFYLPPKLEAITHGPNPVFGHYIYTWSANGRTFYVGSGTNRRAWNTHYPIPQSIRESAEDFKVFIRAHCLTKSIAHRKERALIRKLLLQGLPLTNERIPRTGP